MFKKNWLIFLVGMLCVSLSACTSASDAPPTAYGTVNHVEITSDLFGLFYFQAYQNTPVAERENADVVYAEALARMRTYAVVEEEFMQTQLSLEESVNEEIITLAQAEWEKNETALAKLSVDLDTLQKYYENTKKEALLKENLVRDKEISDAEILEYVAREYYYGLVTFLPLASKETGISVANQQEARELVETSAQKIAEACEMGQDMFSAAEMYLPNVLGQIGEAYESDTISYYVYIDMVTEEIAKQAWSVQAWEQLRGLNFMDCAVLENESSYIVFYRYDTSEFFSVETMRGRVEGEMQEEMWQKWLQGMVMSVEESLDTDMMEKVKNTNFQ